MHLTCPDCGEPLVYDEVDIGVGVIRSPSWCMCCGWSEENGTDELDFIESVDADLADALQCA